MYLGKITVLFVISACISANAGAIKRKSMKTKIKKTILPNIVSPPCGCQNAIVDIINCGCRSNPIEPILGGAFEISIPGCRGPMVEPLAPLPIPYPGCRGSILEPTLGPIAPIEFAISGCKTPVIDIPNYRYAEPLELNPLGCLFPSIEIANYGLVPVDLPCGCPGPQCGCRAPAVKLPACPIEYMTPMDVLSYGTIASVIEMPSYAPGAIIQIDGCRGPVLPSCSCPGPCSCPAVPTCSCPGPCSCPGAPTCGCQGPCSCPGVQVTSCGCKSPCSCAEYQILSCGCQGSCSCPAMPLSPCGCKGPCGCSSIPVSCGCQGPCSCPGIQAPIGFLPTIEMPSYGCGCGLPGCDCVKYLRQVTLQPPFL